MNEMTELQKIMMVDVTILNVREALKQCIQETDKSPTIVNTIDTGLLVRTYKLLNAFMRNARAQDNMSARIVERCIYETCISIRYLVDHNKEKTYTAFKESDAMRKRDLIAYLENADSNLPPEMVSFADYLKQEIEKLGYNPEKLDTRHPLSWHPNLSYADMAFQLKGSTWQTYEMGYSASSEALHQSWSDITERHVNFSEEGEIEPNLFNDKVYLSQIANVLCVILGTLEMFYAAKLSDRSSVKRVAMLHKDLHSPEATKYMSFSHRQYEISGEHPFFDD